jgi:hypothetical protein
MIRKLNALLFGLALAACAPTEPPAAPAPTPGEAAAELYADCTWGEVTSADLSIWSFACANDRLVPDEAGFARERTQPDGQVVRNVAIRVFAKPADAGLDAIVEQVRAVSPGGEACVLEPGAHDDWVFMPTGEALAAHQAFVEGRAEGPSMPCGPLGPSEAGGRTFRVVDGAPDKVVMIDWGTEPPIFDADTLRAAP